MGEELLLEVFGDPSLDDDVAAVALKRKVILAWNIFRHESVLAYLVPFPWKAVGNQSLGEQVLAVDLENRVSQVLSRQTT